MAAHPGGSTNRDPEVLVVGGGIAGLAAALLLARIGRRVTLLERNPHPAEVGAALMLQPNGLAVMEALGLGDSVRATGRQLRQAEFRNHRGDVISRSTMPDFGGGLDHYVALLRTDLHAALLAAVHAEPAITPRFGVRAVAVDRIGSVRIDTGSGQETLRAELVVGADGLGSTVRGGGEFGATVTDNQTTYVRGLIAGSGSENGSVEFAEYWTPLGAFGIATLTPDVTYFYAAAYRGAAAEAIERRDLPAFAAAWRATLPLAGATLDRVEDVADLLVNGVRPVRCDSWVDGRLVLIGDAAHAMAPNLGQGANSALVDAAVLAEELAGTVSTEQAGGRYENRRRGPVTRVQSTADSLARLSGLSGSRQIAVRDAVLRTAGRSKRLLGSQIRRAQQEDPLTLRTTLERLVAG
jgi:2-polyprenyl-6-methoxyphenol hydroxylase-like FAD-dependent oxidoreductase